jgi:hypothetical protein
MTTATFTVEAIDMSTARPWMQRLREPQLYRPHHGRQYQGSRPETAGNIGQKPRRMERKRGGPKERVTFRHRFVIIAVKTDISSHPSQ